MIYLIFMFTFFYQKQRWRQRWSWWWRMKENIFFFRTFPAVIEIYRLFQFFFFNFLCSIASLQYSKRIRVSRWLSRAFQSASHERMLQVLMRKYFPFIQSHRRLCFTPMSFSQAVSSFPCSHQHHLMRGEWKKNVFVFDVEAKIWRWQDETEERVNVKD